MKRTLPQFKLSDSAKNGIALLVCLLTAALGALQFGSVIPEEYLAIAAGVGILALIVTGDLSRLWNAAALPLLGYGAFSMLTIFWAMSGKFFLRQYCYIFIAFFFFLYVATRKQFDRAFARRASAAVCGVCTLYAFAGLEAVSTGFTQSILARFPFWADAPIVWTGRLSGLLKNSNIEASFYALGILLSIALICGAEKLWSRVLWTAALSFNAVAMLLGVSLGALASFAAAVVAYLIFAGKNRGAVLLRMVEGALPALACVFLALSDRPHLMRYLLCAAAVSAVLELTVSARLAAFFDRRQRVIGIVTLAAVLLGGVYLFVALRVSAPHTFGAPLSRGMHLAPGEHTVQVDADGEVSISVGSRNREQIITRGTTEADYMPQEDDAVSTDGKRFTVPEDSEICTITFSAPEGVTLRSATVDGSRSIPMDYTLLPDIIGARLQEGLRSSNSYVLRDELWINGMRLFYLSPVVGNGVGSYETGITRVQNFYFATRYVHQHYIQVLLEDGVIGGALYFGALLAMAFYLWKRRAEADDGEYRWLHPALCAAFVMNGLQMLWDVSMSILPYLCCAYAVYGLIIGGFAEPLGIKKQTPAETENEAERKTETDAPPAKKDYFAARMLGAVLPGLFVVTVCGNLYAAYIVSRPFSSYAEAYETMEKAVGLDLYEKNDVMLTYVLTSLDDSSEDNHAAQANVYADELSRVQSNRLPYYLTGYYFNTMQYARAIDEAMLGASYSASDSEQWNNIVGMLKQGFVDSGSRSPLVARPDGAELLDKLIVYRDEWDRCNARLLKPISLTEDNLRFFEAVTQLEACKGDMDAVGALLEEHPWQA